MNNLIKQLLILLLVGMIYGVQETNAQNHAKDIRQTYLWDVTLSMKGYGNTPKIYDKVVDVLVKDINRIDNERTEIVVIPFQDKAHCEVWKEMATTEGKRNIINKIKAYKNDNVTNTNISALLEYVISDVFSTDKIDILKLMTDGEDNVNPQRLHDILDQWCEIAKEKDAYGYYILLTDAAKRGEISLQLQGVCNFEEVDVTDGNYTGIAEIVQETPAFIEGIPINIRDEYNIPKRLEFVQYMGKEVPAGFEIHFKTEPNPYIEVDEVAAIKERQRIEQSDNRRITLRSFFTLSPLKMDFNQLRSRQLIRMLQHIESRLTAIEKQPAFSSTSSNYAGVAGSTDSNHAGVVSSTSSNYASAAGSTDSNHAGVVSSTSSNYAGAVSGRCTEPIPVVLIGHSKTFIPYNETTLRPFLRWIEKHPASVPEACRPIYPA